MSISVTDISPFSVGDYIIIRGQTDATGTAIQHMENSITGIAGNVISLAEPLDSTYQVSYPGSDWPNDQSYITRITSSRMTATGTRGDRTVTVASTSSFAVGDIVEALDDTNTTDNNGSAQPRNYVHREMAEVRQIVSGTQLLLSHALHHTYDISKNARVSKVLAITNSSIEDANVTWSGMSTVNAAFEMRFTVNCRIANCIVTGNATASWLNQAFRTGDAYMCLVENCIARDPVQTAGGQGYGATLYGATYCTVRNCKFSANRHSVLFYNGAAGNIVTGCISEDCRLSDYDLHGAECVDNLITDCIATGGDSAAGDGSTNKAACKVGNTSHIEGDHHNTFSNMLIVNYQGAALEVVPKASNTVLKDSRVIGGTLGVRLRYNSNAATLVTDDVRIQSVEFSDVATLTNIDGGASSTLHGILFDRCRFVRATTGLSFSNGTRVRVRSCTFLDSSQPAFTYAVTGNNITQLAIKDNDFSGCQRGVKLTACPNARVTRNTMHDLGDTTVYEDAGGNGGTLFARNDIYGFAPFYRTSGTGPSGSGVVDIYPVYQSNHPLRHGLIEWNFDPTMASATGGGQATVSGSIYLMKISAQTGGTVTNIMVTVGTTLGSGFTPSQNFAGLYDDTGARIGLTADQSSAWATAGVKVMALTAATTIQAGRDYFVAILANATTPPSFVTAAANNSTTTLNANLANAAQRFSVNGTSATSLPGSVALSSNSSSGTRSFWTALS